MSKLFDFDKKNKQSKYLIGTDEAGRGPLAGPVVAAAVCFTEITDEIIDALAILNDSKQLSEKQRSMLFDLIKKYTIFSITEISVEEIEKINILQASLKAMRISCSNVINQLDDDVEILIDGNRKIPNFNYKQRTVVKGDATSASIAAASILAKVYRDDLMSQYAEKYPEYDFPKNKGYGTKKHVQAILEHGTTPIHRQSFLKKIFAKEEQKQLTLEF